MKFCSSCKEEKELPAFNNDKSRHDGLTYVCKDCCRKRRKELVRITPKVICASKRCPCCEQVKLAGCFFKDRTQKDGLGIWCRDCNRSYRQKNSERICNNAKIYRQENAERCRKLNADWFARNPEYRRNYGVNYRAEKPHVQAALNAQYRAAKKRATPSWADQEKIKAIYAEAARLTRETGIEHHVDHIYPLQSDWCCGLHVETNLQILVAKQNQSKGNRPIDLAA